MERNAAIICGSSSCLQLFPESFRLLSRFAGVRFSFRFHCCDIPIAETIGVAVLAAAVDRSSVRAATCNYRWCSLLWVL